MIAILQPTGSSLVVNYTNGVYGTGSSGVYSYLAGNIYNSGLFYATATSANPPCHALGWPSGNMSGTS